MFFANGGNQAYVTRVVGTGSNAATRTLNDRAGSPVATLKVSANTVGTWGNGLNISVTDSATSGYFNLTVFSGGTGSANIVEQWPDITMVSTDNRYALSVVNNNSGYITLDDLASTSSGSTKNPSLVSNQALSTGANGGTVSGTTIADALSSYDVIENSLVMNVPGFTDDTTVNAVISYAEGRGDVFVVVDGINDTVANQLTLSESYTASSQAAVYYPQITIADPTVGVGGAANATIKLGAGAALVGLYAATDSSRGVFKAPAGLQARLAGAVSVDKLTSAELDSLNSDAAPVNAIRYIPGSGIVVMGSRTLKPGYVDRYVPVRRSLIYIEKSLKDLTQFAVFEPNDSRLWSRINSAVSSFLTSFWSQGGLSGASPAQAYFVKCDSENNPQSSIDNGIVNIQVGVALQRPAEFVVINIGQYSGGTTITVA
jgi:phage tail sheath protein FI